MDTEYIPEQIVDHDDETQQVLVKWLNYDK